MTTGTFLGYDWPEVRAAWRSLVFAWRRYRIAKAMLIITSNLDPVRYPITTRLVLDDLDDMKEHLMLMREPPRR